MELLQKSKKPLEKELQLIFNIEDNEVSAIKENFDDYPINRTRTEQIRLERLYDLTCVVLKIKLLKKMKKIDESIDIRTWLST